MGKHSANAPRDSSLVLMVTSFKVDLVTIDLHGNVTPSAKITSQFSLKDPLSKQFRICNTYHCDGLLVCIGKDNRLVVWNPCTGETRWIQASNEYKKTFSYVLGYDNKSSCYKILMISSVYVDGSPTHTESEVYDFTSNLWSVCSTTTNWFIPRRKSRGMSVKGTTYWSALSSHFDFFFLSFDFSTERFQSFSLPADAPRLCSMVALSLTRETKQLCMLDTYGSNEVESDVWIATKMEDTGALSWSKFRRLGFSIKMGVWQDHENKVFLCCNIEVLSDNILHIVGDDKYIQVHHYPRKTKCPYFLTYVPSLVQIQ